MTQITTPQTDWRAKGYRLFTLLGWLLILVSFSIGAFVLSSTASGYFGGNQKAVRDAAEAGSALLGQLQTLAVTPHWLEPLTFVGVAAFMVGIAIEFSMIPSLLNNRGKVMAACFPILVEKGE
jgi:hypothetical protein